LQKKPQQQKKPPQKRNQRKRRKKRRKRRRKNKLLPRPARTCYLFLSIYVHRFTSCFISAFLSSPSSLLKTNFLAVSLISSSSRPVLVEKRGLLEI